MHAINLFIYFSSRISGKSK